MNKTACYFHLGFWSGSFCFWLGLTQQNHPDWTLRILCTAILVGMSALYAILWSPRKLTSRHLFVSSFALLVCGLVTAVAISLIYDALLGPDPRRFSFLANLWMDTAVLVVNTAIAAAFAWAFKRVTGRPAWRLRPAS